MTVMPAGMLGVQPPIVLFSVATPSGQTIEVLGDSERLFYESQCTAYMHQNKFTNTSDLLDLDRLLFLELLVYRATAWIGRGQDYDGMPLSDRDDVLQRRSLKETSVLISVIKNDLGLTRSQRDKAAYESVGAYVILLKQRAKEFGIHRQVQLATGITLCKQLFAIVGAFERSDDVERRKIGFENADEVLDWITTVMIPEFNKVDDEWIKSNQRYWTDL